MPKSKGFGKSLSSGSRPKKRSQKYDPKLSLKFEKYVAKHFGRYWNKGCVLMNFDDGVHKRLGMTIPIEKHQEFDEERQTAIKALAKSFGLDDFDIVLAEATEADLKRKLQLRRTINTG